MPLDYHTRYVYFKAEVKAVRKCIKNGFWIAKNDGNIDDCFRLLKTLSKELSAAHSIRDVRLITEGECDCYGQSIIYLEHLSVVSFLHEWRHHYQMIRQIEMHNEDDSRAYSLGLFRKACPTAFKAAWKHGRLLFMPTKDLSKKKQRNKQRK